MQKECPITGSTTKASRADTYLFFQACPIEIEFEGIASGKLVSFEILKYLLVKIQFADYRRFTFYQGDLHSFIKYGIDSDQNRCAVDFFFEILVDDVLSLSHMMEDLMPLPFPERVTTGRLALERLRYEDAEEIFFSYASKPEVTRFVSWPTHRTIEDTRGFLRYAVAGWSAGTDYSYSIRTLDHGRLIGSIGFMNEGGRLQFGYALSPTQWGLGYATEACRAMLGIVTQFQGVFRIHTFVDVDNKASARVLEKSGLVLEARLDNWFRFVNQGGAARDCLLFRLPLPHRS